MLEGVSGGYDVDSATFTAKNKVRLQNKHDKFKYGKVSSLTLAYIGLLLYIVNFEVEMKEFICFQSVLRTILMTSEWPLLKMERN